MMPVEISNFTICQMLTSPDGTLGFGSFTLPDWKVFLEIVRREGVGPLFYWKASKSGLLSQFPEHIQDALRKLYADTWMQNQKILGELEVIARQFKDADIPTVVLKGICYVLTIYPDAGLRPMGDLDLMVPRENLNEAIRIVKKLGYEEKLPEASPGLEALLNHEICLQKTGERSITLEIHHSLVADRSFVFSVPVDWFWQQTEIMNTVNQTRFGGLYMLSPEAQILYAASHAMLQHGGSVVPLRWYYDLDQLIRSYDQRIDWNLLFSQAQFFEWGSALVAALQQTYLYFDTPIPENMRIALEKLTDRHKSLITLQWNEATSHTLVEYQKLLKLTGYARFRLILALIVPGPKYMYWRYRHAKPWSLPIYYILRWWGILLDVLLTGILLIRGKKKNGPTVP
jgi:hypothetical protein